MRTKKSPSGSEVEGLRPFWRPDSRREGQEARLLGRGNQDTKVEREHLSWGVWQRQEAGQEHGQRAAGPRRGVLPEWTRCSHSKRG